MTQIICRSVVGGWQTQNKQTGELSGPIFNKVTDLWKWQESEERESKDVYNYNAL